MQSDRVDISSTSPEQKEASPPSKALAPRDAAKKGTTIFVRDALQHRNAVARYNPTIEFAKDVEQIDVGITLVEEGAAQTEYKLSTPIFLPKHKETDTVKHRPTIFYIPGSAYIATDYDVTIRICSQICSRTNARVIAIIHRIAPENPCPTALNDCYKTFLYYYKHAIDYGIDTTQLGFCGYSSGGNLAALMAEKALRDGITINLQLLVSPLTDLSRSNKEFIGDEAKDTVVSEEFLQHVINYYVVDRSKNRQDADISPQFILKENLKGIAPAVIFFGEFDRTRGDAEKYHQTLGDAGVHALKKMFAGENHAFWWHSHNAYDEVAKVINARFSSPIPLSPTEPRHQLRFIKFLLKDHDSEKALAELHGSAKSGLTPPGSPVMAAQDLEVGDAIKLRSTPVEAGDKETICKKIDFASEVTPFIRKNPGSVFLGVTFFAFITVNIVNILSHSGKAPSPHA